MRDRICPETSIPVSASAIGAVIAGRTAVLSRNGFFCRHTHVVKEGGNVCVALIHLIPQAGEFADVEIACDEGGFARARRRRYPEDGAAPSRIHQTKQPFPGEDARNLRAGDLCKRNVFHVKQKYVKQISVDKPHFIL